MALALTADSLARMAAIAGVACAFALCDVSVASDRDEAAGLLRAPNGAGPARERDAPDFAGEFADWLRDSRAVVGFSVTRVREREMIETGGVETYSPYKHYLVSSDRMAVSARAEVMDECAFKIVLGAADLALHCSEGLTRKFDSSPMWGVEFEAVTIRVPESRFTGLVSVGYLSFEPSGGRITGVAGHSGFRWLEDLDVGWSEFAVVARGILDLEDVRLEGAVRYLSISASEGGVSEGVAYSGGFDQEEKIGLSLGLERDFGAHLTGQCRVNFADETAFIFGLAHRF